MVSRFFFFLLFTPTALFAGYEEPWGTDADMIVSQQNSSSKRELAGLDTIINFHHAIISQADGPRSHYFPSSSTYMHNACKKFGLFNGFTLGCDRLMRENSEKWIYPIYKTRDGDNLKYDNIPDKL